jgi:N-acetylneuraminic acid mutarotase
MRRPASRALALAASAVVGLPAVQSCNEATPTQPSNAPDWSPSTASLTATPNSWSPIAAMPCCDGVFISVGVVPSSTGPSKAYVFGGTNAYGQTGAYTRIYDVATNTWSYPKNAQNNKVPVYSTNGVGNIGDKLYFAGGWSEHDAWISAGTWVWDPAKDTLISRADMPFHTAEGVSGVISNKLYVLPGICSGFGWPAKGFCDTEPIRKLFRYNPTTNIWVTKASAPHYHKRGAGGVINDKFYVVGGNRDFDPPTRALDVYDPATNTWKSLAPLPVALQPITGAVLRARLYVAGGTGSGVTAYAYDPATDKWVSKAPPTYAAGSNSAAKVFLNGTSRLLMINGSTEDDPDFNGSQIYTP